MKTLTEIIEQQLNKKTSFLNLLIERVIWNRSDAESIMKAAFRNVKDKKM